ncbi:SRPBCC family protein [Lewinella sp. W8]|uniref:SRPBCC family protein n=1 Tax=Lewinella sp. W8 TaxID=2528208 RepID=UPI0010677C3C|nr:SRPBCC family protein [Lewinella sp. W8]MTB52863.1 hypothetical protein [Lewinella sp. W8]
MKKLVQTSNPIQAPASEVWEHLRTGEGVNLWLPMITSCRVEGDRRYCEAGDQPLTETILSSDDGDMTFRYSIEEQSLLPIEDIIGTMRVESVPPQTSILHWDLSFEVADEATYAQVKAGLEQIYAQGAEGLERLAVAA